MKYILNKLPIKTTNNFKVNDLKIDLKLPEKLDFHDYEINNNTHITTNIKDELLTSKIGLEFDKYKELNIVIPEDVKLKEPIIIRYYFKNNDNLIDKINIKLLKDSEANIIIIYKSTDNTSCFHALKEVLECKDNSKGNISIINLLNSESQNFISIETSNYENSNIIHNIIDLGGNVKVNNMYSELLEYNTYNKLNNIYLGKAKDVIDMNYYLKNIGVKSSNIIRAEGCLTDESKKTFRGIIDFVKGSKKSIGDELENCALLSDRVIAKSLPELLCAEDDVEGSHGVSSGKVSKAKLFYLMSRGLTENEAKKLIIFANFANIINTIPDIDIQEEVKEFLDDKLSD